MRGILILMIEAIEIADVMGGPAVLGCDVNSLHDLAEAVSGGLPKNALKKTVQRVSTKAADVNTLVYRIVPEATYKRRTRLTASESERTERLARVIATAEYVWDSKADAHRWLGLAHPELDGKTPIHCAMSELGARQVEELLDKIFYGLSA